VLHDCFLISSGPVKHLNSTANSIVFVNGDVAHWNSTRNTIIFCDGNVQHLNGTDQCVIFCTGDVEGLNSLRNSVVFANGEFKNGNSTVQNIMRVGAVKTNHSQGNQYIGLKEIRPPSPKTTRSRPRSASLSIRSPPSTWRVWASRLLSRTTASSSARPWRESR
jgi:hypothetical protein